MVHQRHTVLHQSGYLTIKDYDIGSNLFLLDFPNNEVKSCFLAMVAINYLQCKMLTSFFVSIPYTMRRKENEPERERYSQCTFYLQLRLMSVYTVLVEKEQSEGRVDCIVETLQYVYILEFELDGTAGETLQQIEEKGYAREYEADARQMVKVGVSFSSQTGTIEEGKVRK